MNTFTRYGKALNENDLDEVESKIRLNLPQDFRNHYLTYNGGIPEKSVWWQDEYVYFEIARFRSMKYPEPSLHISESDLLEQIYLQRLEQSYLPETFIPFAYDFGANYFCLDAKNENVYMVFMDLGSPLDNPDSSRLLANGFNYFINNLDLLQ